MMEDRDAILSDLQKRHPDWRRDRLSRASDIPPATVQRWLKKQTNEKFNIEDGYKLKGKSVHLDANGEIKSQWVKTDEDRSTLLERLKLAADAILEPITGKAEPVAKPADNTTDLLAVYPISDVHLGLYAWEEETGSDWDADRCESALNRCMAYLVDAAPSAATCLIPNLGDFFHTDTQENRTARSGHTLDVDTRQARVFQIGVRCYRNLITLALQKHQKVIVKSGIGNHDDHSILSLAMLMKAYFENDERVEIELPVNPFAYHEFGSNLIGINHGMIKASLLPGIMAQDKREAWGRTKRAYWYVGHIHHKESKEFPGCVVEAFRTVGAKDAWSHGKGYRSERDMQLIVLHKDHGEVSRTRISPEGL